MFRVFSALLMAAAVAVSADPPPTAPAMPTATVTVATVTAKDGAFQVTKYISTAVQKQGTRKVKKGDEFVEEKYTYTEVVTVPVTTAYKLKDLKATGTDGKAITADDLETKLKDGGVVVFTQGPLSDDVRKAFKDGTAFIDQTLAPPKADPKDPPPPFTFPGSDPDYPK